MQSPTCMYVSVGKMSALNISVRGGGKNNIIRAKLMYRSGKETVKNILLFNILIYLFSPRNSPNLLKLPPSRR